MGSTCCSRTWGCAVSAGGRRGASCLTGLLSPGGASWLAGPGWWASVAWRALMGDKLRLGCSDLQRLDRSDL